MKRRNYKFLLKEGRKAQIEKLRENDHKCEFDVDSIKDNYHNLHIEMQELSNEIFVDEQDYNKIRREAADVANFAFMIILKCVQKMFRNSYNNYGISPIQKAFPIYLKCKNLQKRNWFRFWR